MNKKFYSLVGTLLFAVSIYAQTNRCFSGIYPYIANYNNEDECGTGAVVPWNGSLWTISYGPHLPFGSSDKLYQITSDIVKITRSESIGGTPANRMIHKESNQLFIGPYIIDSLGKVHVIGVEQMPGRLTGCARNLIDPTHKINIATMEQGFYEIDVNSLDVKTLFKDGNLLKNEGAKNYQRTLCKGVHGKGFYSGQGVYVYSNNGEDSPKAMYDPKIEAGSLSEFDGKEWKTIRRNQFTEVTGPGGIYGNSNPEIDPIWALGWDYKSIIIAVRDAERGWKFFRAPKASNSYDGAHGWNTEWPRIRSIGNEYLMTMHGMFWHFPGTFSWDNTAGIRPYTNYLKVIGDFCEWNGKLVFGCDDSARSEFLNIRKAKGNIAAPGQSNSNLWFTSLDQPKHNGTSDAVGAVWENEQISAGTTSDPFLLAGWKSRLLWISNSGSSKVVYSFEIDKAGNNHWEKSIKVSVPSHSSRMVSLDKLLGEWIRVTVDENTKTTVAFVYGDVNVRSVKNDTIFEGIASVNDTEMRGGILYGLGGNRRKLGIVANVIKDGIAINKGYYELDGEINLLPVEDEAYETFIKTRMNIPKNMVIIDKGSYLIVDDRGRRWRLPLNNEQYNNMIKKGTLRICREVSTERDLFDLGGTFFELPAENADGYAKIRPICTHHLQINDYASFRGMLVMTGLKKEVKADDHIVTSKDGNCKVWCGVIEDLWKLGRPVGHGGPWINEDVKAGIPSDAYLISHYQNKKLMLKNEGAYAVTFTIEIDPTGDGTWMKFADYKVSAGKSFNKILPKNYLGRWIRFIVDKPTKATVWLEYE
ncbi:MAG: hypothetical protein ACTTKN_01435 [Phocaeicola sp.]|uniref:hypothetical protein n=1 Tax=Phocaeicola sp. TaxID=2773926 RepID=UPI003F9F82DB